ncbi:MAG: CopG family transcriptional regulator [Betaproteobacteria bacterium]|nr:CopG family transcriptional regulator [Betaproteobacteria bacterium]
MGVAIQAEIPERLLQQARLLVEHGWAESVDSVLSEALRRYLESHSEQLTERFILDDVAWGLHGRE